MGLSPNLFDGSVLARDNKTIQSSPGKFFSQVLRLLSFIRYDEYSRQTVPPRIGTVPCFPRHPGEAKKFPDSSAVMLRETALYFIRSNKHKVGHRDGGKEGEA